MKILRLRQVMELTGLSRSTLYLYIQNQEFPKQVRLGPKLVGWVDDEVNAWLHKKIQSRPYPASPTLTPST